MKRNCNCEVCRSRDQNDFESLIEANISHDDLDRYEKIEKQILIGEKLKYYCPEYTGKA